MSITMSSTFFRTAQESKSNYACERVWARHFARMYYHEIDSSPGFLTIYNQLLSLSEENRVSNRASKGASKRVSNHVSQRVSTHVSNRVTRSSSTKAATAPSASAPSLAPTRTKTATQAATKTEAETERARGKAVLNRILFKEYNDWFEAFEAEAEEDQAADAASASDRWSWHVARKLALKTGIPMRNLAPIAQAWLIEKE